MNISKNQDFIAVTRDGHQIKAGDTLYYSDFSSIKEFKVKAWHDGKKANVGFFYKNGSPHWYSMVGHGGAGVYPENEDNPFSFLYLRSCFYNLEKAKKYLTDHWKKLCKEIEKNKPKYIKTRYE